MVLWTKTPLGKMSSESIYKVLLYNFSNSSWSENLSSPTLWDPMDCSPPGSSVHGILQARILKWVADPFSRGSSQPRDGTQVSCHHRRILYHLNHQGSPRILEWVVCPFFRGFSQPRNLTGVSCVAGGFFTGWATRDTLLMVSLLENFIPPDQSWKLKEWLLVKY